MSGLHLRWGQQCDIGPGWGRPWHWLKRTQVAGKVQMTVGGAWLLGSAVSQEQTFIFEEATEAWRWFY